MFAATGGMGLTGFWKLTSVLVEKCINYINVYSGFDVGFCISL